MLRLLVSLIACVPLVGCPSPTDTTRTDDTDVVDTDPDTDTEILRPNVQEGQAPNADGQTPAFPEQTRAPQPAEATAFTTDVFARGLQIPWGLAELPDGRLLVTERAGRLRVVATDGALSDPLSGVPAVLASGQGGLLDVVIDPDFATNRRVYLTFSENRGGGRYGTSVARGALSGDSAALEGVTVIYRQEPTYGTTHHFGSRLVFDGDGKLYVTFGDRGSGWDEAQSPASAVGAIIRINPDGTVPTDNPFVGDRDKAPEVWSYGHRNLQAATLGADGALWTVEHGPQGGDELNRPEGGVNHGWPIITYGENYNGAPIGDGITAQEGMAQPVYYWDPVIAPSGMDTYRGDLFQGWSGDLLVGGLQAQAMVRLTLRDGRVYTEEWLPMGTRVRDVLVASDGAILLATDNGTIVRLLPDDSDD